jgi:predicted RNA-binding protein with PIN domain
MLADWLIIDGNNLLHHKPAAERRNFEAARWALARELDEVAGELAGRITLVFDGTVGGRDEALRSPAVEVIYASAGETADLVIERTVEAARGGRARLMVVTSDRAEQYTVSGADAEVMSCSRFLETLADSRRALRRTLSPQRRPPSGPRLGDFFPPATG